MKLMHITGRVVDQKNQQGIADLRVEAWDEELIWNDLLASATTFTDGSFKMSFEESFIQKIFSDIFPNIYFKVYRGNDLVWNTRDSLLWNVKDDRGEVVIVISNEQKLPPVTNTFQVYGTVRDANGNMLGAGSVEAFARTLRHETSLGQSGIQNGQYQIKYKLPAAMAARHTLDLVLKVSDAAGKVSYQSPVQYRVPAQFKMDLCTDGSAWQGASEWETLTAALEASLDGVSPLDIREDRQNQDVTFLSGDTGYSRLEIATWTACWRLADKTSREQTPLDADIFFAFLSEGQPSILYSTLEDDMQHPDRMALLEDKILSQISTMDATVQRALLEKALEDNVIPLSVRPAIDAVLATLAAIKAHYAAAASAGSGKATVGQLLALTPAAQPSQGAFATALHDYVGPMKDFWTQIEDARMFPADVVQQVKLSFGIGALTRNHVPLVGQLLAGFQKGQYKQKADLAKLSADDWVAILNGNGPDGKPVGVPANTDGDTPQQQVQNFANTLVGQLQNAYPTTAFAANMARELSAGTGGASAVAPPAGAARARSVASQDVVTFLQNNPTFQLDRFRVDHFVAQNPGALKGIKDTAAAVSQLKSIQRVFRLQPSYSVVNLLTSRNIYSAQQIYFMGQNQFINAVKDTEVNKLQAKAIYRKAENTYSLALHLFGNFNIGMNGVTPHGAPSPTPDTATLAQIEAIPNLQALFGTLDYCQCSDCRSVTSPAAYFVDIMHYLGQRQTNGTGVNAGKTVEQVLLQRRPDLGDLELSCDNTNTPLPYIDLVNEILEDVVAPPTPVILNDAIETDLVAGTIRNPVLTELANHQIVVDPGALVYAPDAIGQWVIRDDTQAYKVFKTGAYLMLLPSRQTFLSAAELRANPEYTNQAAYDKLKTEVFPFNLPFDLALTQVRSYLNFLGIAYPDLLAKLQKTASDNVTLAPTNLQVDCAALNISPMEYQILTGTLAGKQPYDYWGLLANGNNLPDPAAPSDTTKNITGDWITVLGSVDVMLNRSGLAYQELLQVLDMKYVNPDAGIVVNINSDTNTSECDLSTFDIQNLAEPALTRLHKFVRLWRKLGCAMWELDILLPNVSANPAVVDKRINDTALHDLSYIMKLQQQTGLDLRSIYSLYHDIDNQTYYDHSQADAPAIQTLYQRLFLNKLVDALTPFPANPAQLSGTISASTPGILAALRISENELAMILADMGSSNAAALDIGTLSHLYRYATLAHALQLGIEDFLRLKRLFAQDPFASPQASWNLLQLAQQIAATSFSIAQLDYLLTHHYNPTSGIALDDNTIASLLQGLQSGIQKIEDDLKPKTDETSTSYVKRKLGSLPSLGADTDQKQALAIIDGSWQGSAPDRNALIDQYFTGVFSNMAAAKATLGALTPQATPALLEAEVDSRFGFVQPALQAYLQTTQLQILISQQVGDMLTLDLSSTSYALSNLKLPGATLTLMQNMNDARLVAQLPNGSYQYALNEANFPAIYQASRLLFKLAMVIANLKIKTDELKWWIDGSNAANMGWMSANSFPIATGTPLSIAAWQAIEQFFDWKATLPPSNLSAFDFASNLMTGTYNTAAIVTQLAQMTNWAAADITALVTAFHWLDSGASYDVVKQKLMQPSNLALLAKCMKLLGILGVNAERALQWATATPDSAVADGIKQAIKAKYDLDQWLQVIAPLQDSFREQKRQAMVSWLLVHADQSKGQYWLDADGLYAYFLIDVQMCACMLTSRQVQATAAVQLFVQRCLLNLEIDILASTALDEKWDQWAWMKLYRVWQANREVFLFPENWLEPELRTDKTPFFLDLENYLKQNDVTGENVEDAYLAYLDSLDKVANLEIRAMYNQVIDSTQSVLHVVGRTRSSHSPEYYYRQRLNGWNWTAWQKIDLDIGDDHLVAGMHNNRFHLLWPQLLEKAMDPSGSTMHTPKADEDITLSPPQKYWEIRMCWSELKKGKWTPKSLSNSYYTLNQSYAGGNKPENISFRTRLAPNIQVRSYVSSDPTSNAPVGSDLFDKLGKQLTYESTSEIEHLVSPIYSQYSYNLIQHSGTTQYFYYDAVDESGKAHSVTAHQNAVPIPLLQKILQNRTLTVLDSLAQGFAPTGTFATWDTAHTYTVDYVWESTRNYYSGAWHQRQIGEFHYNIHYHPFVELFIKELNIFGIKGLLNRQIQVDPGSIANAPAVYDFNTYSPTGYVTKNYQLPDGSYSFPVEDVDFSANGAYSLYNWELFFHVPFYIANKLSTNQQFEDALAWFNYIFNPTNTDNTVLDPDTPQQKFWITKPFYETTKADYYKQKIENMMLAIAQGDAGLRNQVEEWRETPFDPHLIARMRTVAYQKNVLIKYIQTLIAWGDQIFAQDTMESVNEATQLYVLAESILGPRPQSIPRAVPNPVKTLYQLEQEGIDDFGNVLMQIENLLPPPSSGGSSGGGSPELPKLNVLYFCIPDNADLLSLWDTVADRLYKIRHCMNIEGVVRQLPLFAPPIDPGMLVAAAAAGLDIGDVLSDMSAPMPLYRFVFMVQRAIEICAEVKTLGNAILQAVERRDAEAFAQLRSSNEKIMLDQIRLVKLNQITEALRSKEALQASRGVVSARLDHYNQLIQNGWNDWEKAWLGLTVTAIASETAGIAVRAIGASLAIIPSLDAGAAGFGATPTVKFKIGGQNFALSLYGAADVLKGVASVAQMGAGMSSAIAGYQRRAQDWNLQTTLATAELPQIDKQIDAADLRYQIAQQELVNHDKQTDNHNKEDDFLHSKFTNQDLYDWMLNELSSVYFQSYQLAYDIAKRAERCFRYELGLGDSSYIQFGYWDSLKQGLLSGEKLHYDIKRMEMAFYEQNRRDYELHKPVSLMQLDPLELLKLRQNGECYIEIPETVFDADYPGHYFRRIKSVSLTIPCVTGPYTTVAATLTMTSNSLRKDTTLLSNKYARDTTGTDPRFRDEVAAIASIATSTAQHDAGLFELNFRDERYLPFEGAGAITSWHLKLNPDFPSFDFTTIADVVVHLDYTARDGGEILRAQVVQEFNQALDNIALAENRSGLTRMFDIRREFPDKWYQFLHPAHPADDQALSLDDLSARLPYFTRKFATKKVWKVDISALMSDGTDYKVQLSPIGVTPADLLDLAVDPSFAGLHHVSKDLSSSEIGLANWVVKIQANGAADFKSLPADAIKELFINISYKLS